MDSVLSNEVARRIAADLATLVSEAEKHGTLPRIKSVAFYFNETELRTIIKLLRSCHGILDPAQPTPEHLIVQLDAISRQIQSWLDWDQKNRASTKPALMTDDGTHIMALPVPFWPTHGAFKSWIKLFSECSAALAAQPPAAPVETKELKVQPRGGVEYDWQQWSLIYQRRLRALMKLIVKEGYAVASDGDGMPYALSRSSAAIGSAMSERLRWEALESSGHNKRARQMFLEAAGEIDRITREPQRVSPTVTDEMVTAAMRAFEPMSSVLRYREKDKWHSCDIMGMRDAIKAALALTRPQEK